MKGGETINTNSVYIPSLDGKDIFISNNCKDSDKNGYRLRNNRGGFNVSKFINTLDFSLDLIKLRDVYEKVYRRKDFSFVKNRKEYTNRVINVTFKYSNKEFNRTRANVYVKFGHAVTEHDFVDNVCIWDGELVAIKTNEAVSSPISSELLGKYFYFDHGVYLSKNNISTLNSVADIREKLYSDGFVCDGIRYVRFKRSSGSSRVGKCLFIDEKLYNRMHAWEMCGIKIRSGQDVDLASLEPYIALTLSSIIDTIEICPENILVVDDYESVFKDKVVATRLVDGKLSSCPEVVEISNSIWDGQSLMDKSLFGAKYENYGMLLLRARFFKSCCFNSNIQKWFADNGITSIEQLNGYTRASKVEDIKLITTPSSIKYLKFGTMDKWFDNMESVFGVVKHEKPTHFFDGKMVQTHYQLLNTLQMTQEEVDELVRPSLEYIQLIKNKPSVLRYHIKFHYNPDGLDTPLPHTLFQRNDIVYKMLGLNDKFCETKLYYQFRKDLLKAYILNLRNGHILVRGNYSTLCGNPIEMLKHAIGQFDGSTTIEPSTVHSINFDDGSELLGSRSPHVTIGNVLVTKNRICSLINRYMNPTREIVYVNSIKDNLLERLSGSDFDSDTLLLTDNKILVSAAKRNYSNFPVPTKLIESAKRSRRYTSEEQADLDVKTSINKIGEIINLSQELNSLLWDRINKGASIDEVMDLYCDIAQLDVMSNLEIDSAKRENPANNAYELQCLKKKYDQRDSKDRHIRPMFFKYIDESKGYRGGYNVYSFNEDGTFVKKNAESMREAKRMTEEMDNAEINKGRMTYLNFQTTMDYLQHSINKCNIRCSRKSLIPFSNILIPADALKSRVNYNQVHRIINLVRECKIAISLIWEQADASYVEKAAMATSARENCIYKINKMNINDKTALYLISLLDNKDYTNIKSLLFTTLFWLPNKDCLRLIQNSKLPISIIQEDEDGDLEIYGSKYKEIYVD